MKNLICEIIYIKQKNEVFTIFPGRYEELFKATHYDPYRDFLLNHKSDLYYILNTTYLTKNSSIKHLIYLLTLYADEIEILDEIEGRGLSYYSKKKEEHANNL